MKTKRNDKKKGEGITSLIEWSYLLLGERSFVDFRHGLILLWFTYLMNVTEEVTIHRPNVSTFLSSAFIRGDLNAATRGPFI